MSQSRPSDDSPLPVGVTPLEPQDPRELGGHRILGRIGQGGMGLVYLGQMRSGRRLAIKVVRADYARDAEFRSRFRREAVSAQKVRGHFTAALIDADLDGPSPWLATEYVPGPTLAQAVAADGPLAEPAVRALVAHLAEALQAVHRAGLVHRDLKAGNVLLGPDGPCLIDLGIAQSSDSTALTATGAVLGTPMVMAPEQATGSAVSPATDVWALGALASFAATGRHPFGKARADVMYYRVVHEDPQLDACPDYLRPFVLACLSKDPADRPAIREILDAQPDLVGGAPTGPVTAPPPRPAAHVPTASPAAPATSATSPAPDPAPSPLPEPVYLTSSEVLPDGDAPTVVPSRAPDPAPEPVATPPRSRRGLVAALAVAGLVVVGAGTAAALTWPWGDAGQSVEPDPTASPAAAVIDPCLVGRWEQTSLEDEWTLLGETVPVTGWEGRVLEFRADGTEVVRYDEAEPVRAEVSAGEVVDTWRGSATFTVTTHDGTLAYETADYSGVTVEREVAGLTESYTPPSTPGGDLTYTCDETTHRQSGDGYAATFTRVDG